MIPHPELYEYLTGIQYLNFMADVFQLSAGERREAIKREAEDFGIYDALGDLISSYSHGMKQKLAIIGGLSVPEFIDSKEITKSNPR